MNQPVLNVKNLTTEFATRHGAVKAVNNVSFSVGRGEILGLVGESGSGKSQTGYSLMNLVDSPGRIAAGQIELNGLDLRQLSEAQWRHVRGKRIAMIFQDPMLTLNPVLRIDTQMIEAVQAHSNVGTARARDIARECLVKVGIASPDERLAAYPHQFSGGMRQRVAIAIALIHQPELIIADEPTTALDVTIQEQILFEMQKLSRQSGTSLIWITHDLSVVAGLADQLAVMYAGQIVEYGAAQKVLHAPAHPYTLGLLRSAPARNPRGAPLYQIAGLPPSLLNPPQGCAFRERCESARAQCSATPPLRQTGGAQVRCIFPVGSAQEQVAA